MQEYEVGPWMSSDVRRILADELGARDGDTVIVYPDGEITLGRLVTAARAARVTSLLRRAGSPRGAWRCGVPRVADLRVLPGGA